MGIFNKTRKEKIQAALSEIIVNNLDTDDSFNLWEFKDLLRRFKEYEAKECSYLKKYVSDETERILKLIFKQVKKCTIEPSATWDGQYRRGFGSEAIFVVIPFSDVIGLFFVVNGHIEARTFFTIENFVTLPFLKDFIGNFDIWEWTFETDRSKYRNWDISEKFLQYIYIYSNDRLLHINMKITEL